MKEVVNYSEALKRAVAAKIERGEYTALEEARQKKGVRGSGTVEKWVAERVNGIVKQEYGLGGGFKRKAAARRAINEAVRLFNTRRSHLVLAYNTPDQAHSLQKVA